MAARIAEAKAWRALRKPWDRSFGAPRALEGWKACLARPNRPAPGKRISAEGGERAAIASATNGMAATTAEIAEAQAEVWRALRKPWDKASGRRALEGWIAADAKGSRVG